MKPSSLALWLAATLLSQPLLASCSLSMNNR